MHAYVEETRAMHRMEKEISESFKMFKYESEYFTKNNSTNKAAKPSPKFWYKSVKFKGTLKMVQQ